MVFYDATHFQWRDDEVFYVYATRSARSLLLCPHLVKFKLAVLTSCLL